MHTVDLASDRSGIFAAARRHSTMVRILKKVLPVLAALAIVPYLLHSKSVVSIGENKFSIEGASIYSKSLKMTNPHLTGADKKGGSYDITADSAIQDITAPHVIKLENINAKNTNNAGETANLRARNGVFDSKTEQLQLRNDIQISTSTGITAILASADVDMQKNTVVSHQPLRANMSEGSITAQTMYMDQNKRYLKFSSVKMIIQSRQPQQLRKSLR
jgi:lipopolysaccharide export system protein LptC